MTANQIRGPWRIIDDILPYQAHSIHLTFFEHHKGIDCLCSITGEPRSTITTKGEDCETARGAAAIALRKAWESFVKNNRGRLGGLPEDGGGK